ncbi:MAG: hypothetical protein QNJ77_02960 [Acidimicrobiia bacterium]|nr:hypothetical protein [Acidimicrobiia bacterium]
MFWLRRPPYLRWIGAGLLLAIGVLIEFRPIPVERYPFAAEPLAAGTRIDEAIDWRDVPGGLMPAWAGAVSGIAAIDIETGDPLLPSVVADQATPTGWWSIPVPLVATVAPGTRVRLVAGYGGAILEGIVVEPGIDDGFETVAMVAFPPSDAPLAAAAAANDALVVMIGH